MGGLPHRRPIIGRAITIAIAIAIAFVIARITWTFWVTARALSKAG